MDFPSDSILMSHMGEGNWQIAREDEPVRLIKRSLGIGKLDDPPTFLFQYQPGPATMASLVSLGGERFRLVVPRVRCSTARAARAGDALRPVPAGLRGPGAASTAGCGAGGPHHLVMNLGRHGDDLEGVLRARRDRVRAGLTRTIDRYVGGVVTERRSGPVTITDVAPPGRVSAGHGVQGAQRARCPVARHHRARSSRRPSRSATSPTRWPAGCSPAAPSRWG